MNVANAVWYFFLYGIGTHHMKKKTNKKATHERWWKWFDSSIFFLFSACIHQTHGNWSMPLKD